MIVVRPARRPRALMSAAPTILNSWVHSLIQPLQHFLADLAAEFRAQRRAILLVDVVAIEHVEFFQDRVALARHGEDAQPLRHRPNRALDLPAPDGVGAAGPE